MDEVLLQLGLLSFIGSTVTHFEFEDERLVAVHMKSGKIHFKAHMVREDYDHYELVLTVTKKEA